MSERRQRPFSLADKWRIDAEAYKKGGPAPVASPQCEGCAHFIRGNAFHCEKYVNDDKPQEVIFAKKECRLFSSNTPLIVETNSSVQEKLYGGVFGFCIGDFLGVPVEFCTREERKEDKVDEMRAYGTYFQGFGSWSDDTSLMLCLINAFQGGFSLEKLCSNMIGYYQRGLFTPEGKMFDIGISTQNAIGKMIAGVDPVDCGGKTDRDNGNGSLMRILPLAFIKKPSQEEEYISLIKDVSSVTHGHPKSLLACIFYTVYARALFEGKDKLNAYETAATYLRMRCRDLLKDQERTFRRILSGEVLSAGENEIRSTGYVIDTLEAVLWVFHSTDNYRDAVLKAVNLGGDTDTIAALVGGLAGIFYGFSGLPENWVQSVKRKDQVYDLIKEFEKNI